MEYIIDRAVDAHVRGQIGRTDALNSRSIMGMPCSGCRPRLGRLQAAARGESKKTNHSKRRHWLMGGRAKGST